MNGQRTLTLFIVCIGLTLGYTSKTTPQFLQTVLTALEKGLLFLGQEYKKVNLDAIIGTRIVDGQLQVLMRRLKTDGGSLQQPVLEQIIKVQKLAEEVSDKAIPWVKRNQPAYYAKIGALLDKGFWQLDYKSRHIDSSLISIPLYAGETMKEVQSDNCLAELFGTGKKTTEKCRISPGCWDLMTSPGYRRYSLSHETFYLQIGQLFGCFSKQMLIANDQLNAGFCANMLREAETIVKQDYPLRWRDLFMEQAALCGMQGYQQFFRSEWLEVILNWQRPSGCFGIQPNNLVPAHRMKREEKQFADGCQCHRTAVAVAALGQYVRYIIEYMDVPRTA